MKPNCDCGSWSGVFCEADAGEPRIIVRYVPDHLKETAKAAGTVLGLVETARVTPDCAKLMMQEDPEWSWLS